MDTGVCTVVVREFGHFGRKSSRQAQQILADYAVLTRGQLSAVETTRAGPQLQTFSSTRWWQMTASFGWEKSLGSRSCFRNVEVNQGSTFARSTQDQL
jgi:hypothetical protein